MKYAEKLKDPRWQKRRLLIMERDGWKCKYCKDDKCTLNVHHLAYKGEPWDAPDESLITLCQQCHSLFHWLEHENFYEREFIFRIVKTLTWDDDVMFYCILISYDAFSDITIYKYEVKTNTFSKSSDVCVKDIETIQQVIIDGRKSING